MKTFRLIGGPLDGIDIEGDFLADAIVRIQTDDKDLPRVPYRVDGDRLIFCPNSGRLVEEFCNE